MASAASSSKLYLGLDSSTQGLKATAIDKDFNVVHTHAINFARDLPHFALVNGVHAKPGHVVTQPTLMFVEALDLLFSQMAAKGFPFAHVAAVSGSGQQHGSVYWRKGAFKTLEGANAGKGTLAKQLAGAFSIPDSPIWMDSSTSAQCAALEKAVGGAQALSELTGSRAYERFTGNQIAKIAATNPAAYKETERISLISSFMCSLINGKYAPIDASDGCGMNLLNLRTRKWEPRLLDASAPGLAERLGEAVPSHAAVGTVSQYLTRTYGFSPETACIAWSGDNPCSVAGLGLSAPGDIAVSLGTSDTMFGILPTPHPGVEGHLFANPVDPDSYMAMLCYKNGSLTRERVRNEVGGGTWESFNKLLSMGVPGNGGALGFYVDYPEIMPSITVPGTRLFSSCGDRVKTFTAIQEVRAVVESQFLSMRIHGDAIGIKDPKRLIATGGGSGNPAILQILADVFGAPVYVAAQTDSASLGAAVRALHGMSIHERGGKFVSVESLRPNGTNAGLVFAAAPRSAAHAAYTALLPAYKKAEARVVSGEV